MATKTGLNAGQISLLIGGFLSGLFGIFLIYNYFGNLTAGIIFLIQAVFSILAATKLKNTKRFILLTGFIALIPFWAALQAQGAIFFSLIPSIFTFIGCAIEIFWF